MRISRIAKFTLSALAVIALIAALNAAFTFALVPYGSKSELAWSEFDAQDKIDTVFVGTSISAAALDPRAFDERYGTRSFNLSTPNQTLEESLIGIQTAYERFHMNRVVMALEYTALQTGLSNKPGDAFMTERSRIVSAAQTISADWWLLTQKGAASQSASVNMPFPWLFNRINFSLDEIRSNMRAKTNGTGLIEAAELEDPGWSYYGSGYGNYTMELDYNGAGVTLFGEQEHLEDFKYDQMKIDTLNEICEYCAQNGIELVAVAAPVPVFNVLAYSDSFFANSQRVAEILAAHGVAYRDFNLAKPELFQTSHTYFRDNSHMNAAGARAFDASLMRYMDMLSAGEDTGGLFYTPEEYLASIDYIDAAMTKAVSTDEGVRISSSALAGPGVRVEYQYWVSYDGESWELVEDYGTQPSCVFVPKKRGTVSVRACVREAGSALAYEYYQDAMLLY